MSECCVRWLKSEKNRENERTRTDREEIRHKVSAKRRTREREREKKKSKTQQRLRCLSQRDLSKIMAMRNTQDRKMRIYIFIFPKMSHEGE